MRGPSNALKSDKLPRILVLAGTDLECVRGTRSLLSGSVVLGDLFTRRVQEKLE